MNLPARAALPLIVLVVAAPAADAATLQIPVSADAHVSAHARPNGHARTLRVDGTPRVRAYLRFALPTQSPSRVILRIRSKSRHALGFEVRPVHSQARWSEQQLRWQAAPRPGRVAARSGPLRAGRRVAIDVTRFVSERTLQLALTTRSRRALALFSRESRQGPELLVEAAADATDRQPTLPIRGMFYYPWFPEAWTQGGVFPYTRYSPTLGHYDGSAPEVINTHLRAMEYAHVEAPIASWWGRGHHTDRRIPTLLAQTAAARSPLRWTLYYEHESEGDPSAAELRGDLAYIRDRYGSNPAFLRIGGRHVVFVYADGGDGCGMSDRWRQAADATGTYVVLKVFPGYRACRSQPDGWHQYAPAVATDHQSGHSFSVSPGFWKVGEPKPRLGRDVARFRADVAAMLASGAPFQLVATFNEWGEGTAVESASDWPSASGYGSYLDALHDPAG